MSYDLQVLKGEPVILATLYNDFEAEIEYPQFHRAVHDLLNQQRSQVYYILDLTQFSPDLASLMAETNEAVHSDKPTFRHPNVYEIIFITTAPLMKMTAQGMNSEVFGHIQIAVFPTLDEALAHTRN